MSIIGIIFSLKEIKLKILVFVEFFDVNKMYRVTNKVLSIKARKSKTKNHVMFTLYLEEKVPVR